MGNVCYLRQPTIDLTIWFNLYNSYWSVIPGGGGGVLSEDSSS